MALRCTLSILYKRVCQCTGAPHTGGVLDLWAYNALIYSLTDTYMFSFYVSFDKTQRFISVRCLYVCLNLN